MTTNDPAKALSESLVTMSERLGEMRALAAIASMIGSGLRAGKDAPTVLATVAEHVAVRLAVLGGDKR